MATGLLINRNGGYMTIQLEEFLQTAKRRKKSNDLMHIRKILLSW